MKRRTAPPQAHMLEPGYFTELIRRHNWPPMFEPQSEVEDRKLIGAALIAHRERQVKDGTGWGNGTVVMAGTPGNSRPTWMQRRPG